MKMTVVWGITSYIHGDVLKIRVLFLLSVWHMSGIWGILLSQLSEKGYRFLLGYCFVKIDCISFCIIPFRFVSVNFVSIYFVSHRFRLVSMERNEETV
jgi:hypothetical protein